MLIKDNDTLKEHYKEKQKDYKKLNEAVIQSLNFKHKEELLKLNHKLEEAEKEKNAADKNRKHEKEVFKKKETAIRSQLEKNKA